MADEEPKEGDMGVMHAQAQDGSPCKDNQARHKTSVDQVPLHRHSLNQRMRVGFRTVIEREHAMEGFGEELYEEVGRLQTDEAYVVWCVGSRPEPSDRSANAGLLEQIRSRSLRL